MTKMKTAAVAVASVFLLEGCVQTPLGPTAQVFPQQGKPFEVFANDQAVCKQYAAAQVQGQADVANERAVGGALLGTALGAGLGAAVGSGYRRGGAGYGAGVGAAGGAVVGTGLAAGSSGYAQGGIQVQYNNAYVQCMVSKGNTLPAPPPVVVQPAPYLVQPAPYVVPGPGPGYGPGPAYGY